MEMQAYREAQSIRAEITKIESLMSNLKKYEKREHDAEFNHCRETAYNTLEVLRQDWENRFSKL